MVNLTVRTKLFAAAARSQGEGRGMKRKEDDGRARVTTDRGRGNNLANRVGPGAGWSIGACDCDNIRMRTRTGGWRDWMERGRALESSQVMCQVQLCMFADRG